MPRLVVVGLGYSAQAVIAGLGPGWQAIGTRRQASAGAIAFDGEAPSPALAQALRSATHLLQSAPPGAAGDPLLRQHRADVRAAPVLRWVGYLSTIGVYGDRGGGVVDETTAVAPDQPRSLERVAAEDAWLGLGLERGTPVQLFRLGGVYGPGRSALDALRRGRQQRVVKPGQVFNRIHVEDVGSLVRAGMARPEAGPVLHGVDGSPTPQADVVAHAAALLGIEPPPAVAVEEAGLSPMGLSFWQENRRVANVATRAALGWQPRFPSYREGLAACLRGGAQA